LSIAPVRLSEVLLGSVAVNCQLPSVAEDRLAIVCPCCGVAVRLAEAAQFTAHGTVYRCPRDGAVVLDLAADADGGVRISSPAPVSPMAAVA
jgi:predicted RNA-binding Zn-ribbon protein involved in translation (DUF1610 family)